ncbi:MAG: thiamine diphosphokinase [Selenomonadaceae bacterium]|nr:thiamine diphosphokinase [Selenomonadaceae bacterium]
MNLPQCVILYMPKIPECEILFAAGGRVPSQKFFKAVAQGRKIFAVDKGIEICRACNILPKILIGDFDSAESAALDWAIKNKIPVERHPVEKDFTDTQLALELLPKKKSALITGIFGGRFDHLFSNVLTCANVKSKIFLADEKEIIFYVKGGESVKVRFFEKPVAVSLLPITEICAGVKTENLHWELSNATLKQNFPNAVSNRAESSEIKISVERGTLALYFCFSDSISA